MRIIPATDPIVVPHPVLLIFGQPGIGKTSLAYSAGKRTLLLDADRGAHRAVNRGDTVAVESWKDIAELADAKDALAPYDAIALDTVGRVLDHLAVALIEDNPKFNRGGGDLSLQGFGALKARFKTWLARVQALGKDVVLLAHGKEDKDGDNLIVRPDVTGGSYAEIMKLADFVGFLYMRGRARTLDFNPTDRWVGKNPGRWEPINVPPADKATTFLAGLIEQGREALGAISDESAQIVRLVAEWGTTIANVTTADECNAKIVEIDKLAPMAAAQVKHLLAERIKAIGVSYDKQAKKFVGPKAETVPD